MMNENINNAMATMVNENSGIKGDNKMNNEVIKNKYDFVLLFDVKNGNPNGDPDTGMARTDAQTGVGQVTDMCLKRKIRNYIELIKEDNKGYGIYVKQGSCLTTTDKESCKEIYGIDDISKLKNVGGTKEERSKVFREFMCKNFYDIRTFGQPMATMKASKALNSEATQIKGVVQIAPANSVDVIFNQDLSITRCAVTRENDADEKDNAMGRKCIIPYGLYYAYGHIDPNQAKKNDFTESDLELLWQSIINMFEFDRSSMRGEMAVKELIVFKHESCYGNYPSDKLFDTIKIEKKDGVIYPRKYKDYNVEIDKSNIPNSVTVTKMI